MQKRKKANKSKENIVKKAVKKKQDKSIAIENANNYIWVNQAKGVLSLTDDAVKLGNDNQEEGIAYYYKDTEENIVMWRFDRDKGWTEDNAKIYILSIGASLNQLQESLKTIQEYDGEGEPLTKNVRKSVYNRIAKAYDKLGLTLPQLNSQSLYKTMKTMQEKMQMLAQLSNESFHAFIDEAQKNRLNVTKSEGKKEEPLFKVFGNLEAFKVIKNVDGQEVEAWKLRTTFTSNKADLQYDITSQNAIKNGVEKLQGKVIPIRFEHESQDYGAWDTFKTQEVAGVLYGIAEGELDQNLSRAQDLWKELYTYGKQFATSYGGHWLSYSYVDDATYGVLRVFEDVEFDEISLTTRPANPDTALEVMNKSAGALELSISDDKIKFEISKNMKIKKEDQNTETTKPVVKPVAEETTKPVVEPKIENLEELGDKVTDDGSNPNPLEELKETEVKTNEDAPANETDKSSEVSLKDVLGAIESLGSRFQVVEERVNGLEEKTAKSLKSGAPKSVAAVKNVDNAIDDEDEDNEMTKEEVEYAKSHPMLNLIQKAANGL